MDKLDEFQDCYVFCLDCYNKKHGTGFTREEIIIDYDAPCHQCGKRPVVAWTPARGWRERLRRVYMRVEDLAWRLSDRWRAKKGR